MGEVASYLGRYNNQQSHTRSRLEAMNPSSMFHPSTTTRKTRPASVVDYFISAGVSACTMLVPSLKLRAEDAVGVLEHTVLED